MSYSDATEQPLRIQIGGKTLEVKPLTQRDYLPWLNELTEQGKERDRKLIPPVMKGVERFQLAKRIEMSEMIPADLEPISWTGMGAIKIIQLAIVKAIAGKDATEAAKTDALKQADEFIDGNPSHVNQELAARMSGLFNKQYLFNRFPPDEVVIGQAVAWALDSNKSALLRDMTSVGGINKLISEWQKAVGPASAEPEPESDKPSPNPPAPAQTGASS